MFSKIFVVLLAFHRKNSEKESLSTSGTTLCVKFGGVVYWGVSKMESVLLCRIPFFLDVGGGGGGRGYIIPIEGMGMKLNPFHYLIRG